MWIAVIAVVAITLALVLPALIPKIDFEKAREEAAHLKTFGNALQDGVKRHVSIPSHTNWADFVAAESGFSASMVATNSRRQPRLLLIDTNGWFQTVTLPYTQTAGGSAFSPLNARMMIVSSLGKTLPISAGPLSATEFLALWKTAEGTTNFPTTGVWAGWGGRADDVKIERVNLSPLFVSLGIETHATEAAQGQYGIGSDGTLYPAPYQSTNSVWPRFYIRGTEVRLYHSTTSAVPSALDSRQLMNNDAWFLYQNQIWRSSGGAGGLPGGVDISGVVLAFLSAVPNTQARYGAAHQRLAVEAMMNYMSNYNIWAEGGFTDDAMKGYLLNTAQPNMIGMLKDLFQGSYYPTNASGPQ